MQQLLSWTLDTIREEKSSFSWMEECRYEWAPLVKSAVSQLIKGKSVLVLTDEGCDWFGKYVINKMNVMSQERPFFPFYHLNDSFPHLASIKTAQDISVLEDMLEISHPNGYYIWYIGEATHPFTKIAYRNDDSFLWIIDEEIQNSFLLRRKDGLLDIKLLQLYKLFDKTICAVMFGELEMTK